MRLSVLLKAFPVRPRPHPGGAALPDPEVTGVELDSRRVAPDFLFVAVPGETADGRRFAAGAVEAGAVAVLAAPGPPAEGWPDLPPFEGRIPWFETEDPRALAGPLAARAYGHPERELVLTAITGTNGKTTVTALLGTLLETVGHPTAVLGTLGYRFQEESIPANRTTPEATETLRLLRRWRDQGAEAAAMEASSHALALHRLDGLAFDAAVFTNLTQDHFDFHRDFETYFAAKRHLFDLLKEGGRAVVNVGDAYGRRIAEELEDSVTFGGEGQVRAREVTLSVDGIRAVFETPRGEYPVESRLLGRYNLENLLAAAATGEALAIDHDTVRAALARQRPLPGRLEPVDRGQPFPVYVDYAHTPGGLESVLRAVAEFSGRRIIVVFGAGGDRDRAKRALMGRVAGELAELPILSSDNPRSEDPLEIIRGVEEGVRASGNTDYRIVPDRREAIRRAIVVAGPEHVVVVAGKGHEEVQEIGDRRLPFSDREEIARALEERFGATDGG